MSAINSALSGLAASFQRVNVSAQNIANTESTLTLQGGQTLKQPYVPQRLQQSTDVSGGVTTHVEPVNPPTKSLYDPNNAAADANGITQYPNVDTAEQLVNLQIARYDAEANLSVIKVQDKLFKSVLNIVS